MNKKEKIEIAVAKLTWDTPEGRRLAGQIAAREQKRRERVDDIRSAFSFIGICIGVMSAVVLFCAALICPLYFYGDNAVTIFATNVSASDYEYISSGNSDLHIKYENEQRNLNDNTIIFTMYVSHTWHTGDVMAEFLSIGNLDKTVSFYEEPKEKEQ